MKKIRTLLVAFVLCATILGANAPAYAATSIDPTPISDSNVEIVPYADIIEWRYKVIDGKLYKRQFNYSKDKWIGSWILVS